jgi:hypothetical protein
MFYHSSIISIPSPSGSRNLELDWVRHVEQRISCFLGSAGKQDRLKNYIGKMRHAPSRHHGSQRAGSVSQWVLYLLQRGDGDDSYCVLARGLSKVYVVS